MTVTGMHEQAVETAGATGVAAAIRRHPLIAYFTFAFAGTWILFTPILLSAKGFGILPLPDAIGFALFILATYAGPFLAALILTRITEGTTGLRAWFRRMVQWRVGLKWYLLVLIGYPVVFGVPAMLQIGTPALTAAAQNWPSFLSGYLAAIPIGFFLPTLGEEAGWRGFALPRLQQEYGPLLGTLILAVLHAAWHLPAYFIKGAISATGVFDPSLFVANSLAIVASTFVWTWLFNNTAASILFATFMHATSNALSGALLHALNITRPDPWFTFEVMGVVALVLIAVTRGRLSYSRLMAARAEGQEPIKPEG